MGTCATCRNEYDGTFRVTTPGGEELDFDSIQCAAERIAPTCAQCGCTILGHGLEHGSEVYCCANCARHAGVDASDRVAG